MHINLILILLVSSFLLVLVAVLGYRSLRQFQGAKRMILRTPNGIAEFGYVEIGGIPQWIQIRGENRDNPVLLMLHGGPGVSYIPFGPCFEGWEADFTVVHWDQRGSGKTFGRSRRNREGPLTIGQMVQDGIEVCEHLTQRLGQDKIVLFAHSWGSILGVRMANERPDLFSHYFGAGQVVDMADSEPDSYRMLASLLSTAENKGALKMLESVGPPPYREMKKWMVKQRLIVMTSPPPPSGTLPDVLTAALFTPGYSLKDSIDWYRSFGFSLKELYDEMMTKSDARRDAPNFEIPVCFIQGEQDMQAPLRPLTEYVDALSAPSKELIVLSGEGHTTLLSAPEVFLEELTRRVSPC